MSDEISYDDFAKLDIRIGTVVAAELVPETDKLIKCTVDFGDPSTDSTRASTELSRTSSPQAGSGQGLGTRTIVSGIAQWKKPEELIGKQFPYIVNLAPRVLRGVESQGMLLAASDENGVVLLFAERELPAGTKLK